MDAKLQKVLLEYGMEGYGLYWYCLELVAGNVSPDNITFELEHDARIIARNTGLGVQKVEEIMSEFLRLGLFEGSEGRITCLKLARRADDYISKLVRRKMPQAIENKEDRESPRKTEKLSKSPPRREENRTEEKMLRFAPPSVEQVRDYCRERRNDIDPSAFVDFYEAKGWYVGKTKMKDWKAAVRTWEARSRLQRAEQDPAIAGAL